tara:strand:- start:5031 stop:5411 length:381 start_codon:yes stop_codon:yes gene_type:complete
MSGLNSVVDKIVSDVFSGKLIGGLDLTVSGVYKHVTTGAYTASSRSLQKATTDIPIEVIKQEDNAQQAGMSVTDNMLFMVRPIEGVLPAQGIDDEVVINNKVFKVVGVSQKTMGDTTILYEVAVTG